MFGSYHRVRADKRYVCVIVVFLTPSNNMHIIYYEKNVHWLVSQPPTVWLVDLMNERRV